MITRLKKTIKTVIHEVISLFTSTAYKSVRVPDLPDNLDKATVYIVGEGQYLWYAAFKCPCKCGAIIQLSLMRERHPFWKLEEHFDRSISLHPSIHRTTGCHSHFFLRHGIVKWCHKTRSSS
jgi:hypothetical protein